MRHPEYYVGRAEETRIIAEQVRNPKHRVELMEFARQYEQLAEEAREFFQHRGAMIQKAPLSKART
jgi:hypothetical protein